MESSQHVKANVSVQTDGKGNTSRMETIRMNRNLYARRYYQKRKLIVSDLVHQLETAERRNKFLSLKILELKQVISQAGIKATQVIESCDV